MEQFFNLQFLLYVGVGFLAQTIDGALGMAYGVKCSRHLSREFPIFDWEMWIKNYSFAY